MNYHVKRGDIVYHNKRFQIGVILDDTEFAIVALTGGLDRVNDEWHTFITQAGFWTNMNLTKIGHISELGLDLDDEG